MLNFNDYCFWEMMQGVRILCRVPRNKAVVSGCTQHTLAMTTWKTGDSSLALRMTIVFFCALCASAVDFLIWTGETPVLPKPKNLVFLCVLCASVVNKKQPARRAMGLLRRLRSSQ
jgi:hypothetical protein